MAWGKGEKAMREMVKNVKGTSVKKGQGKRTNVLWLSI